MFRDWSILELVEVKRVSDVSGLVQVVYDEYNGLYSRGLAMLKLIMWLSKLLVQEVYSVLALQNI